MSEGQLYAALIKREERFLVDTAPQVELVDPRIIEELLAETLEDILNYRGEHPQSLSNYLNASQKNIKK